MKHGLTFCFLSLFLYFTTLILPLNSAFSYIGPWAIMSRNDLKVIDSAKVEALIRLEMIEQAKQTIDLVIWDQGIDQELGLQVLEALNRAARRGVKVRFVASWQGSLIRDIINTALTTLNSPLPKTPIEYYIAGGMNMKRHGWGLFDGIHEKMLLVDKRIVLTTGRGHHRQYFDWMDTAFIYKGELIQDSIAVFENFWTAMKKENGIKMDPPPLNTSGVLDFPPAVKHLQLPLGLINDDSNLLQELQEWIAMPSENREEVAPENQLQIRILHHDLLKQLRSFAKKLGNTPSELNAEWRMNYLKDPILAEIIRLLEKGSAHDFKFYTLSVDPHPKLKEAIIKGIKERGMKVELFTNSRESHTAIIPVGYAVGWYNGLNELDELLQAGVTGIGFDRKGREAPYYTHRKMAIIDDVVIFGSHNLSKASTYALDEISFEVKSLRFANEMRTLFEKSKEANGKVMDPQQIHEENVSSPWHKWIAQNFQIFF